MRLLDLVCQSTSPPPGIPSGFSIPTPGHFAQQVTACPLRIVLADELVRCSTQLAYSEGDRLAGCLDLIHAPMQSVWIEWSEVIRQQVLREIPNLEVRDAATAKRVGLLVQTDKTGRAGTMRTFWSTSEDVPYTGSVVTEFDLDHPIRGSTDLGAMFDGEPVGVSHMAEPAVDAVLNHVQYRLDTAWRSYYGCANLSAVERNAVARTALSSSACDAPMTLALFLLMTAKDGVQRRTSELAKVNRARRRMGRAPLLEHVEAFLNLRAFTEPDGLEPDAGTSVRRPARLHHVRGHLARRGNKIFWRCSHLRGSARLGSLRSRTVALSFH